ncbi:hypothetical protein LTR53_007770 [Teratosphaeriaceae sp. CCFEE 6253]|nr:hypothetical protein LTR53_007770 [Teratosphaeriaceae sp. CCFEE 6253]
MSQTYTFSPVTATDHAGLVWVAAILSLMFSVLTLATRFQIKARTLGLDDWTLAAGTLVAVGQYIAIYVGLSDGVGTSTALLRQEHAQKLGRTLMATQILFLLAMTLCKLSVVLFMRRLFTREFKMAWLACHIALILTVVWGVGSILTVSVGCGPSHTVYGSQRCVGKLTRWGVVTGISAFLEIFYVALAFTLVYPLQMARSIKVTVVGAFAFRLLCAVFAALHALYIARYVRSSDPGLAIANVLVWQQVELGYALIAATIPTLKSFIRGYSKAMGWESSYQEKRGLGGGYNLNSYGRSKNASAQNSRLRSTNNASRARPENLGADDRDLRPHEGEYHAGAYHDPTRKVRRVTSTGSGDSEDPIIRRDVSVTVEHESAGPVR